MVRVESHVGSPLDSRSEVGGYDGDIGGGGRAAGGSAGVRLCVENTERVGGQGIRNSVPPGRCPVAGGLRMPGRVVCVPVAQDEDVLLGEAEY